jgi:predicted extracellular nuclease
MDTLAAVHPRAAVVVMGDFNTTPDDAKVERILLGGEGRGGEFVNLMSGKKEGSYKFRGRWSCLDQIIVLRRMVEGLAPLRVDGTEGRIFNAGFLLVDDEKDMGYKPRRTYSGPRYEGGVSDHLPVFVDLKRVE